MLNNTKSYLHFRFELCIAVHTGSYIVSRIFVLGRLNIHFRMWSRLPYYTVVHSRWYIAAPVLHWKKQGKDEGRAARCFNKSLS